jgi:hypothetical protein
MKTQKVEIELPAFEDWEFVRLGGLTQSELESDDIGVLACIDTDTSHIMPVSSSFAIFSRCFIYKRKSRRRVVLEEYKIDYLQAGDIYIDAYGNVNKRFYTDYDQIVKYPILKKLKDEFND